eukprot:4178365-Prorocentrum_lima.AAC.1
MDLHHQPADSVVDRREESAVVLLLCRAPRQGLPTLAKRCHLFLQLKEGLPGGGVCLWDTQRAPEETGRFRPFCGPMR